MKLYLYDFDKTVYHGDSSFHFFLFCFKKGFIKWSHLFKIIGKFIQYKTKNITKTELKEFNFSYIKDIPNIDEVVNAFWDKHRKNLKQFYLEKDRSNHIIISGSLEFLLEPICKELGVKDFIASDVDKKTGKFNRPTTLGTEKVLMIEERYPKAKIIEMWSDSYIDVPLLDLAEKSYMVKGNKIYDYRTYKPNIFKRFWRWGWNIYHKKEEIWNYLIAGGLTTLISIGSFILFSRVLDLHYIMANVLSWITAVLFAYCAYRWFVFHSKEKNKVKEFVKFIEARLFTLFLDTTLMIMLVDLFNIDDVISKILVQVVVLVTNYLISKFIVFRNTK